MQQFFSEGGKPSFSETWQGIFRSLSDAEQAGLSHVYPGIRGASPVYGEARRSVRILSKLTGSMPEMQKKSR